MTKRLGVNATTANTVASFGTTAGVQGYAGVFPALVVVYISNVANIPFDLTMYIMSVIVIAIGSRWYCWCSWVTATVAASVSLSGTGLGAYFTSISPILAIDPLIDMDRHMPERIWFPNKCSLVDKIMGTIDKDAYNNP